MELSLIRDHNDDNNCYGRLYVDGVFECDILEDPVREQYIDGEWDWRTEYKIPGHTAIPSGRYEIIVNRSPRFKEDLPLLLDVPDYEGVRIHPGNYPHHTEGCLLPGNRAPNADAVWSSRRAFASLFTKILAGLKAGSVYIDIRNEF